MSPGFRSRLFTGVAALLLIASSMLGAQPGESDITVVVTADRVLTEITSIPGHVTIITEEEIRTSGATNLVDLLERQAGISFRSFSNEAQAQVDMRGFGEGSAGRVLVLVDGRRQNSPDMLGINWLGVPIDSIERIEVVRGSAAALYGNNAVGGVINIITRTPDRPLELTAFGSFGSFLTNQERLGVTTAGERSRLRASAEHFSTDGHRDRSAYRALNFSLGAEFDPTDRLTLSLGGRYANLDYELPGSLTKAEFEDDPTQAGNPADEGRENHFTLDADLSWTLNDVAAADLSLGYNYKMVESDMASYFLNPYSNRDTQTVLISPAVVLDWDTGRLSGRSRIGADFQWVLQDLIAFSDQRRTDKTNDATLGQWMTGLSLGNTVYLSERFDLALGIRYDVSEISGEKGAVGIDESTTHQAVVFDAGMVFRPTRVSKVYGKTGTLFRYPTIDQQAQVQGFSEGFNSDLDPERGFTVEVGGGLYYGRVLQADVSMYLLQMRDEIEFVDTSNVNLDETRRIGGDLTLSSEPIDQLRVAAGYSFVRAEFIDGDDKGNQVPLVPNHSIDAELGVRPVAGLEFGPAVSFRSDAYQSHWNDPYSEEKVGAHFLADLFLRFRPTRLPGDLSLSAEVKNLFDVQYAPLVYSGGYYPAPGRSFQVAASYRY